METLGESCGLDKPGVYDTETDGRVVCLDESSFPTELLQRKMRGRRSIFPFRRRAAHNACLWLIRRRETALGIRQRSAVTIIAR